MEGNKKTHGEEFKCSTCGNCVASCGGMRFCHEGRHRILRWVLGIVALLIVFWMGFKLGELKAIYGPVGGGYGFSHRYMMGGYGGSGSDYYPSYGMMNRWYGNGYGGPTSTAR